MSERGLRLWAWENVLRDDMIAAQHALSSPDEIKHLLGAISSRDAKVADFNRYALSRVEPNWRLALTIELLALAIEVDDLDLFEFVESSLLTYPNLDERISALPDLPAGAPIWSLVNALRLRADAGGESDPVLLARISTALSRRYGLSG
jgi:hypothetical protein